MLEALTVAAILAARPADRPVVDEACFARYEQAKDLPPGVLRAIARVESGLNPLAVNAANRNGTTDMGLMQINSIHIPRLQAKGWTAASWWNPCKSIAAGAGVLRAGFDAGGGIIQALSRYNTGRGDSPIGLAYAARVLAAKADGGGGGAVVAAAVPAPVPLLVQAKRSGFSPVGWGGAAAGAAVADAAAGAVVAGPFTPLGWRMR